MAENTAATAGFVAAVVVGAVVVAAVVVGAVLVVLVVLATADSGLAVWKNQSCLKKQRACPDLRRHVLLWCVRSPARPAGSWV